MAEHTIHRQKVVDGQMVRYTDVEGNQHDAVVKLIHPDTTSANLQVRFDGADRFIENVPFSHESKAHSWSHLTKEEAVDAQDEPETKQPKARSKKRS